MVAADGGPIIQGRGDALAQLIGLPGKTVKLRSDRFYVYGKALPEDTYPVPDWLSGMNLAVRLGKNQYFLAIALRWLEVVRIRISLPGYVLSIRTRS